MKAAQPHAGMAALLAGLAEARAGQPSRYALPFPEARAQLLAEREPWLDDGPACEVSTRHLVVEGRSIAMQLVRPPQCEADRVLVYLHGGGWCVGSSRTHEAIVRRLADGLRCVAWSIDYALAPERPFPAGLLDCVTAIEQAAVRHPGARIVVAGDSAGANLALGAAMWLRHRRAAGVSAALPDAMLLFYGVYTDSIAGPSMEAYGDGRYGLSIEAHSRYLHAYLGQGDGGDAPVDRRYLFQLDPAADLRGLPPAFLLAAQIDILRDQGVEMAAALQAAGNEVEAVEVPGVIHGFLAYGKVLAEVGESIDRAARFVRRSDAPPARQGG